jgi:ADP-ribose pyrophosphatase
MEACRLTMDVEDTRLRPWTILKSQELLVAAPWIKVLVQQVQLPNGRVVDNYYHVRLSEYAGVVAQTTEGEFIIERQYKHGVGRISLMLPGGLIEDGEDPLATAQRELVEETGYVADEWNYLGSFASDANQGGARAHLFAARNARQVAKPDPGDLEEIEILLMKPGELVNAVRQGKVVILGAVAAIAMALNPKFSTQAAR